jgi:Sec-independent protein translocase protein TatA
MVMRKFLLIVLGAKMLTAASGFSGSLIDEYQAKAEKEFGEERYTIEQKALRGSQYFKKAREQEKQETGEKDKAGRLNLKFYEKIVPLLCKVPRRRDQSFLTI